MYVYGICTCVCMLQGPHCCIRGPGGTVHAWRDGGLKTMEGIISYASQTPTTDSSRFRWVMSRDAPVTHHHLTHDFPLLFIPFHCYALVLLLFMFYLLVLMILLMAFTHFTHVFFVILFIATWITHVAYYYYCYLLFICYYSWLPSLFIIYSLLLGLFNKLLKAASAVHISSTAAFVTHHLTHELYCYSSFSSLLLWLLTTYSITHIYFTTAHMYSPHIVLHTFNSRLLTCTHTLLMTSILHIIFLTALATRHSTHRITCTTNTHHTVTHE